MFFGVKIKNLMIPEQFSAEIGVETKKKLGRILDFVEEN